MSANQDVTSVRVHRDTHRRLKDLKPYDSVTFDEFLREMADVYEERDR